MVARDYIGAVKTTGVRELKAHLSAYLREVAAGEVVLVTDRGRVVAELRPPGGADRDAPPAELRRRRLVERGVLRPASDEGARSLRGLPPLRLPEGTARALLDAERAE